MTTARADGPTDAGGVQVAILAKAPIAGLAKTRLIPALGPSGAARLQRRLTVRTLRVALRAKLGSVTLWCAPDTHHPLFRRLGQATGVHCLKQVAGNLGCRMHAAFEHHRARGPLLLIGTDCAALTARHLQQAAAGLAAGDDAVFIPVADGGYVLVGLRQPQARLFTDMAWSTVSVMQQTRARAKQGGLRLRELETLWDLDVPADLKRLSPADVAALGVSSR